METFRQRALRKLILVADGLLVVASMGMAFALHSVLRDFLPPLKHLPPFREYATLVYLALPLWLSLIALTGLHRVLERPLSRIALLAGLLKMHLLGLAGLLLILFVTQARFNRSLVALFLSCTFVLLYLERRALGLWARFQHRRGQGQLRVLLVGSPGEILRRFVAKARAQVLPPEVLGYLEPAASGPLPSSPAKNRPARDRSSRDRPSGDLPRLGGLQDLSQLLHEEAVDRVLFFPPVNGPADVPQALALCEELGVPADFAVAPAHPWPAKPRVLSLCEQPFISLQTAPKSPQALALKHGLDVLLAALGLLLSLPVVLPVALAIVIFMGRPVLFVQERIGLNGRRFRMIKFRTMVRGAEKQRDELLAENEMSGPVFKDKNDPRVTTLGLLLRRTSLDELPQLLNVLRGEMSLVGPRPLPIQEQQQIHGTPRRRLTMKPGITGLWQVSGRNTVDFEDWMLLDLKYVDEWSLALDLQILLRTIPAVLLRRGAR